MTASVRVASRVASLAVLFCAANASALGASGPDCAPVQIASDSSTLPSAWAQALAALVLVTTSEGLPWSCPGGTVSLTLEPGKARGRLVVSDAQGRHRSRTVDSPEDVGPTGKALLAELPGAAARAAAAAETKAHVPPAGEAPVALPRAAENAAPPANPAPRLVFELVAGPRYSGPAPTAWMSVGLRGAVEIQRWSAGLWTRLDLPVAYRAPAVVSDDDGSSAVGPFSMLSVSGGISGARSFTVGPVELKAAFVPSIAVTVMEQREASEWDHPGGARVWARLGAEIAASLPIAGIVRGLLAVDGELAPAGFGSNTMIYPSFPAVPAYTLGVAVGVQLVVR